MTENCDIHRIITSHPLSAATMSSYDEQMALKKGREFGISYTKRRIHLLLIIATLAIIQVAGHRFIPSSSNLAVHWSNRFFTAFPDQAFERLVRGGQVSPAPPDAIQRWIGRAKREGNLHPSAPNVYIDALTYTIAKGTELPNGMYGIHSRIFLLRGTRELPFNAQASDNTFLLDDGNCIGPLKGCASL